MAFTLIVDFRGLCLFAPHVNEQNVHEMHVLLPDETADHGHGHHHPPHLSRFIFEDKYNAPGNTNPARGEEPFHGLLWDLSAIAGGGADLTLPTLVIGDVEKHVQPPQKLKKHQLRRGQQIAVKSHVVLTAGKWDCYGVAPLFRMGPGPVEPMTGTLRWVISGVQGDRLSWEFTELNSNQVHRPEPLVPVDGIIKLTLRHAPNEPALNVCDGRPNHFPAYYPVLNGGGPMPRCTGEWLKGSCSDQETLIDLDPLVPNVFTCMIGKTTVDLTD
jgi:hypothetical protein